MSLERLSEQLESTQHAPTEQWDPPYCGEIPLCIRANGDWEYQGSKINRLRLVKLFASVLTCEQTEDGGKQYFLVTPVEKVKIKVEDAPFLIVDWHAVETDSQSAIQVVTNIDERYILSERTPLVIDHDVPYVSLPRGMTAKVHRNVYYQWAQMADITAEQQFLIYSAGQSFTLGQA